MPVLNVPFRLIFAYNPQRDGVLDNQLQPQKAFQFRFAVGIDLLSKITWLAVSAHRTAILIVL